MAGELQPAQGEDAEQVADVQAVGGRVEAGIGGRRPGVEQHPECFVAHLVDEVAKREILREGRHRSKRATARGPAGERPVPSRVTRGRARPRPRARCGGPRSPSGPCARRRRSDRASPAWPRAASSWTGTSRHGCDLDHVAPCGPGKVGDVDLLRGAEQPLEDRLVELRRLRQKREYSASAVVQRRRTPREPPAPSGRARAPPSRAGRRGRRAGRRPGRPFRPTRPRRRASWTRRRRCRWRRGSRARGAGPSAWRREPLEVANRHRGGGDDRRPGRRPREQRPRDARLGRLVVAGEARRRSPPARVASAFAHPAGHSAAAQAAAARAPGHRPASAGALESVRSIRASMT